MPSSLRTRRRRLTWIVVSGGVTAALAAGLALGGVSGGSASPARPVPAASSPTVQATSDEQQKSLLALARRMEGDPMALGRADAPVVLIAYEDFQCPFCGKFARETKPELLRKYVDKGVLRIEWRNFPIFGAESEQAARAAWAAGQQGRFWQFHDVAYAKERARNQGEFSSARLREMAREAGVPDLDRFEADKKSKAAGAAVGKDQEEGYVLGVSSTPAFLVNTTPILGAQPLSAFGAVIEQAAKEAG
ncbi:Disulfide bond formation protein D precursor [Nonomuraea coxensis DSM 45129]|uniref:Disulfide bond formation protein D n=1 Tax=Nonomuraea coxensis DSM 45129 TaxID=1122611 RepID=A0ABX8UHU8_9ACTN|nr:thioredoxin domain-containing protein [Nonomuraea coxensis]QYC45823.1 Disulfide bond formation protein D precursor [Nonomuraea coxensis DSM 45129]